MSAPEPDVVVCVERAIVPSFPVSCRDCSRSLVASVIWKDRGDVVFSCGECAVIREPDGVEITGEVLADAEAHAIRMRADVPDAFVEILRTTSERELVGLLAELGSTPEFAKAVRREIASRKP